MKIDRIELFHVAIPLPRPFHPAWIPGYPQTANRFTLARLTTDNGVQGLAAGVAFEHEREGLGSLLGPYLIGLDGVAVNCDVQNNPRDVDVVAGLTETTQFDVTCAPLPDGPPVAP